jgi:WD40 repeat protein
MHPLRRRLLLVIILTQTMALVEGGPPGLKRKGQPKGKPAKLKDRYGDPLPEGALARLGTPRLCHPDSFFLTFSSNWKLLASLNSSGEVSLVEVGSGKEIHHFRTLPLGGYSIGYAPLAFSPDGKTLACGCRDNTLRLWEVATGKERSRFSKVGIGIATIAFSQDSRFLASGGYDGSIYLFDPSRGNKIKSWKLPQPLSHLAFSTDGKSLISGVWGAGRQRTLTLRSWAVPSGKGLSTQKVRVGVYYHCTLSPSGQLLAGPNRTLHKIRLWDLSTGKERCRTRGMADRPSVIVFSANGKRLAASSGDGVIRVWDTATGKSLHRFKAHAASIHCLALSPDGKTLATTTPADQAVHVWDLAKGKEIHSYPGHRSGPLTVAFSGDGKKILTVSRDWSHTHPVREWADWSVRRWDAVSGKELNVFHSQPGGEVHWTVFSPGGKRLAWVNHRGVLRLWEVAKGKQISRWQVPTKDITLNQGGNVQKVPQPALSGLFFHPDGMTVVATYPGGIGRWEMATGRKASEVKRPVTGFEICLLSPDGKTLAVSEFTGRSWEVCLVAMATGRELRRLPEKIHPWCMAFSPDGKTLATGEAGFVRLWEVASGLERGRFKGGPEFVFALAFSPDGQILADGYGNRDCAMRLWQADTGKLLGRFEGHRSRVESLSFSPDGGKLVSGSYDNTALVWDVAGALGRNKLPAVRLTQRRLDKYWDVLARGDGSAAFQAIGALVRGQRSPVPFLAKQLAKAPQSDPRRIQRLVDDLDSDQFQVRQQATRELEKYGKAALPFLRKALAGKPSPEVRRRAESLVKKLKAGDLFSEDLRALRVIEVLEHLGTPEARKVLQTLAKGKPQSERAREAAASLKRLGRRAALKP